MSFNIAELPKPVQALLISHLSAPDLARFLATSKKIREAFFDAICSKNDADTDKMIGELETLKKTPPTENRLDTKKSIDSRLSELAKNMRSELIISPNENFTYLRKFTIGLLVEFNYSMVFPDAAATSPSSIYTLST